VKGALAVVTDLINIHLKQTKNGTVFTGRYNNLNELMERAVTGPVRVQGTADGVLPIGVKVDGAGMAQCHTYAIDSWVGSGALPRGRGCHTYAIDSRFRPRSAQTPAFSANVLRRTRPSGAL